MREMNTLDVGYLRQRLSYDKTTGVFRWLQPRLGVSVGSVAGHRGKKGYVWIGIDGVLYLAHRLAWAHYHGSWPTTGIDHRNRDTFDNRIANLRPAPQSKNIGNSRGPRGYLKGAFPYGKHGRWFARIGFEGRYIYLGSYATAEEAHAAYREAAVSYFGEFARFE